MQLYDKDLLSMQEVRELVEAAKEAQKELANMTQSQVDHIVRAIADAGVRNARRLAEMAHEDTGFGKVEDKIIKNIFGSRGRAGPGRREEGPHHRRARGCHRRPHPLYQPHLHRPL